MGKGSGNLEMSDNPLANKQSWGNWDVEGPRPVLIFALGWTVPHPLFQLITTAGHAQKSSLTSSPVKRTSLPSSLPPRPGNPALLFALARLIESQNS